MSEVEWARLKAHELRALARADAIAVLPVAALEQHGPHLPVDVDTRLVSEIARRAARRVAAQAPIAVLPAVWHGLSAHHLPFGGTVTLDPETFLAVLRCIGRSLVGQGFRRICVLNGHGGNVNATRVSVADLGDRLGATMVAVTYWHEAAPAFARILERQANVLHACEAETSMMLALAPELVDATALDRLRSPDQPGFDALSDRGSTRYASFASRSANGVIGDPALATADKGERLLEAAAEAIAALLLNPDLWAPMPDLRAAETGGVPLRRSRD